MSVLSDRSLAELYSEYHGAIGPASIDLAIGDTLLIWPRATRRDPRRDQSRLWSTAHFGSDEPDAWVLYPGYRYLATTAQRIRIPNDRAGQIGARSSWARDGLAVICGPAGWLDPDYIGNPTLELSVVGSELVLWPGAVIAQLILHQLDRTCERGYQGKYQNDSLPTPSRMHLEVGR